MSLAMKYAMKKRLGGKTGSEDVENKYPVNKCVGAGCPGCDAPMCYGGKMADGGRVGHPDPEAFEDGGMVKPSPAPSPTPSPTPKTSPSAGKAMSDSYKNSNSSAVHKLLDLIPGMGPSGVAKAAGLAHGGEMDADGDHDNDELVMRIMKKRYSMGGEVANDVGTGEEADEEPNQFDDLVKDDELEEHETGANSGDEIGDEAEDEDQKDVVSRIMKSRAKKGRMPRPA